MIAAYELSKQFVWGGESLQALDKVSFGVNAGEVFGLLGPNGAGKTTTLRIIMGLLRADSGFAEVGGNRAGPDSPEVRSYIGMVSTNDGVYPWLTAREMLLYFADLYSVKLEVARQRLEHLADRLSIGRFLDQRCSTLSTGQKQRVILARGLMHDPPVMLLDEPTRGLDVVGSQTVFEFIAHLKEMGKAVLLSTHRLDEAERVCDRFGLLHRGNLMYAGSLEEIRAATGQKHLTQMFLAMMKSTDSGEPLHAVTSASESELTTPATVAHTASGQEGSDSEEAPCSRD